MEVEKKERQGVLYKVVFNKYLPKGEIEALKSTEFYMLKTKVHFRENMV